MIIVNNLSNFHDLYTSLSVTIVMYFNRRNRHPIYLFTHLFIIYLVCCDALIGLVSGF